MKNLLKIVLWVVFAVYLSVLSYIPFAGLLQTYNIVLLLWCTLAMLLLVLLAFILLHFNKLHFLVFAVLLAALHLAIFYVPNVKTAFDIDSCLDSGGVWRDAACLKTESP